jgi:hypothetical protein
MRKTYRFLPPFSDNSFTKRFSSDAAALQYASDSSDAAASYGVGKPQEGFWNVKYQCFIPVECMAPVMEVEQKLQAEIGRLRALLSEQSYRNERLHESENHEMGQ